MFKMSPIQKIIHRNNVWKFTTMQCFFFF